MKIDQYAMNINVIKGDGTQWRRVWRANLTEDCNDQRRAIWGSVITPHGIVRVRTAIRLTRPSTTTFEMVHGKTLHLCEVAQSLNRQDLIRWADRYARWVGEGSL